MDPGQPGDVSGIQCVHVKESVGRMQEEPSKLTCVPWLLARVCRAKVCAPVSDSGWS